jgi:anthranilate synthase component 1
MSPPRRAVAHTREFLADTLTPLGVYRRLAAASPYRFLFESVTGGEQVSRYSFLGAWPAEIYRLYLDRVERARRPRGDSPEAPLAALRAAVEASRRRAAGATSAAASWAGSATTWCGCSSGCRRGRRTATAAGGAGGAFDRVVVSITPASGCSASPTIEGEGVARRRRAASTSWTRCCGAASEPRGGARRPCRRRRCRRPVSRAGVLRRGVRRAQEHIAAGDIFQVVLARRFRCPTPARRWRSTRACGW